MSAKKKPRIKDIRKQLRAYDQRYKLTERSYLMQGLTKKDARGSGRWAHDTGRALLHYDHIHQLVKTYAPGIRGKNFLHLGSSTGIYTRFLQHLGANVIGFDYSEHALNIAKKLGNKRTVRGDITLSEKDAPLKKTKNLPFKDSSVDCILSDNFLFAGFSGIEHGFPGGFQGDFYRHPYKHPTSKLALKEIHEILSPGGVAIIDLTHLKTTEHEHVMDIARIVGFDVEEAGPVGAGKKASWEREQSGYMVLRKPEN